MQVSGFKVHEFALGAGFRAGVLRVWDVGFRSVCCVLLGGVSSVYLDLQSCHIRA